MKVKRSEQRLRRRGSQDTPGGMVLLKLRHRRLGWQRLHGVGVLHAGLSAGSPKPEPANFSGCWGGRVCVGTISGSGLSSSLRLPRSLFFCESGREGGCTGLSRSRVSAAPRRGNQAQVPRAGPPRSSRGSRAPGLGGWGGRPRPACALPERPPRRLSASVKTRLYSRRSMSPLRRARSLRLPPARATSPPRRPPSCLPPQTTRPPAPCRPPPPRSTTRPATARSLPILTNGTFKIRNKTPNRTLFKRLSTHAYTTHN